MPELDHRKLGNVVDSFYEAALRPELWRDALHGASNAIGAEGIALVSFPDSRVGFCCSKGIDELVDAFVRDGWHLQNPRAPRALSAARLNKGVLTERDIFNKEELDRLPFNSEFINRQGYRWFAGCLLAQSGETAMMLSIERLARHEPFSKREVSEIEKILPHLRRASQLSLQLALARSEGMLDAFSAIGMGAILLDFRGRPVRVNRDAERHLGHGIIITRTGVLASHRDSNAALQRLLGSVLQAGPTSNANSVNAVPLPRLRGRPLVAIAAPVVGSAGDLFQQAKAILLLIDVDKHRNPAEAVLRQAFGLTPAETKLAIEFSKGLDLREVSAEFGIAIGTVRVQLKSIFAKTGVNRQSELATLLERLTLNTKSIASR